MGILKKKALRNRIFSAILIGLVFAFQGCYIVKQGLGQFDLRFKQVSIDEAVANEKNPRYQQLLAVVPAIKAFAVENLQLEDNGNYTGYFSTGKKGISFAVTACRKDKLIPYTWWFPIVGSVPYKGFFSEEDALELESELRGEGFDTWVFAAPAYSSLGWFKDPVTTPMLRQGYYNLVETIIHEMTHTTLYVKGNGDFNEQLASFVGKKGAMLYFRETGSLSRKELERIKKKQNRNIVFARTVQNYSKVLEKLYMNSKSLEETLRKRETVFSGLIDEIVFIYPDIPRENWKFNNARLLQYVRYQAEIPLFRELWHESGGNWSRFWKLVDMYLEKQG